jgi:hypothetical protein
MQKPTAFRDTTRAPSFKRKQRVRRYVLLCCDVTTNITKIRVLKREAGHAIRFHCAVQVTRACTQATWQFVATIPRDRSHGLWYRPTAVCLSVSRTILFKK